MKKANGKLKGFGRFLREEEGMGTVDYRSFNRSGHYLQDTAAIFGGDNL